MKFYTIANEVIQNHVIPLIRHNKDERLGVLQKSCWKKKEIIFNEK